LKIAIFYVDLTFTGPLHFQCMGPVHCTEFG